MRKFLRNLLAIAFAGYNMFPARAKYWMNNQWCVHAVNVKIYQSSSAVHLA